MVRVCVEINQWFMGVLTKLLARPNRSRFGWFLDESIALVEFSKHGRRARVAYAHIEVGLKIRVPRRFGCRACFDPAKGYARPLRRLASDDALNLNKAAALGSPALGRRRDEEAALAEAAAPSRTGLVVCLVAFFAHFYSFAIQETITTPFVTKRYAWSQAAVNYLFAAVSVLSLVTSVAVSRLSKAGVRDFDLLVLSLVLGLSGSLLLIDAPLFPALGEGRFLAGFALITVAFPFGRNVALAIFSKVLGPAEQGEWMGLMFVVGALPRCLGPSWSLYALQLACVAFPEPAPCPPGGRTCLEFALSGLVFAASLGAVARHRTALAPYGAEAAAGERAPLTVN